MRAGEVVVLYYDFLLRMERKRVEKLRYMHRNPVKRGVVADPDRWAWSSFRGMLTAKWDRFW